MPQFKGNSRLQKKSLLMDAGALRVEVQAENVRYGAECHGHSASVAWKKISDHTSAAHRDLTPE